MGAHVLRGFQTKREDTLLSEVSPRAKKLRFFKRLTPNSCMERADRAKSCAERVVIKSGEGAPHSDLLG